MSVHICKTMEDYVMVSPHVLKRNLRDLEGVTGALVAHYVAHGQGDLRIVASGSSFNACVSMRACLEKLLGVRVDVITPSRYVMELPRLEKISAQVTELFVSQSGCSTNILQAMDVAKENGHMLLGLTGNVESAMAETADLVVEWGVGNETVDFVTLGVTTLMLFLAMFAVQTQIATGAISSKEADAWISQLGRIPDAHADMCGKVSNLFERDLRVFLSPGPAFMCGDDCAWGVALEGALKWQETLKRPAMAYEPEEYIHGPNMQLSPDYRAFFFSADSADGRIWDIYRATREVTDCAYLFDVCTLHNDSFGYLDACEDSRVVRVGVSIDPVFSPMVLVPAVQLIVSRAMRLLDCEKTHPLFSRFEQMVSCKTRDYDDVMAHKVATATYGLDGNIV